MNFLAKNIYGAVFVQRVLPQMLIVLIASIILALIPAAVISTLEFMGVEGVVKFREFWVNDSGNQEYIDVYKVGELQIRSPAMVLLFFPILSIPLIVFSNASLFWYEFRGANNYVFKRIFSFGMFNFTKALFFKSLLTWSKRKANSIFYIIMGVIALSVFAVFFGLLFGLKITSVLENLLYPLMIVLVILFVALFYFPFLYVVRLFLPLTPSEFILFKIGYFSTRFIAKPHYQFLSQEYIDAIVRINNRESITSGKKKERKNINSVLSILLENRFIELEGDQYNLTPLGRYIMQRNNECALVFQYKIFP